MLETLAEIACLTGILIIGLLALVVIHHANQKLDPHRYHLGEPWAPNVYTSNPLVGLL